MFLHEFKYELKRVLRQKEELFWVLLFPIILGTMFHFALGNLNNTTENFHTIPAAVCVEKRLEDQTFEYVLESLSKGEDPLLELTYTDWDDAVSLLEKNTVRGIFQVGTDVTLNCVPSDSGNATLAIEQSILEAVLREYKTNFTAVKEIVVKNPEKNSEILDLAGEDVFYGKELSLTPGNMDNIVQYYFNLIAMACLFTSFAGSYIAMHHQANLTFLGARKCVSPNSKFLSVFAQFSACLASQFFCMILNILYLFFVIKIDFGTSLPLILITSFFGCVMGISFGFFVGSIGRIGETFKNGIMVSISLLCCFLSGLMIGNMRSLIESACPFINDINPAVLISDSFLTLNIYGVTERYGANLFKIFFIAVVFTVTGCFIIRRKTYASL